MEDALRTLGRVDRRIEMDRQDKWWVFWAVEVPQAKVFQVDEGWDNSKMNECVVRVFHSKGNSGSSE